MKRSILLLIVFFVSFNLFAQKGISFQGIARDPGGNAITNETVSVKFTIGSFSETQNLTTDDFGIFSATIGSVNTTDFNNLIFANIDENLKVEVDQTTIYDDKFNTVPYAKAAENGVPVGSIMPFAGAVISGGSLQEPVPGWVVCNGATLSSDAKFDELKTVLGSAWSTGKVPDLRGVFLRGINNGRTGTYSDPETRDVGDFQDDTFKHHNHPASASTNGKHHHLVNGDGAKGIAAGSSGNDRVLENEDGVHSGHNENTEDAGSHTHTITIGDTGGAETRPINAGVNFIIKY